MLQFPHLYHNSISAFLKGLLLKDMVGMKLLAQYLVWVERSVDVHFDYHCCLLLWLCDALWFPMKDLEILNPNFCGNMFVT